MSREEKDFERDEKKLENQVDGDEKTLQAALHGHDFDHDVDKEALRMTPAEETRLLRRIDLWIVPYASL
jgi:hypothetical protein